MDMTADSPDRADAREPQSELRRLTKSEAAHLDESRRNDRTDEIMADAERRDEEASLRDSVSDERARLADREAFSNIDEQYLGQGERRAAALDRAVSKHDRESSAEDRAYLAHDRPETADEEPLDEST